MNRAFVFVKPHANTEKARELVETKFGELNIKITKDGEMTGKQIDEGKHIDQHYYAIASKATLLKPKDLPVPADKFKEAFGIEWEEALAANSVYNAADACTYFGMDGAQLEAEWRKIKKSIVKFGGGFYCGLVNTVEGKEPIYVFNAFFMSMRSEFVKPDCSIHFYVVEFDSSALSWADFRGKVLGPTNPADAPKDSLRGLMFAQWEALGLTKVPDNGLNGVHASASPFEGLAERMNWLSTKVDEDEFGKVLIAGGVSEETIKAWSVDPQVEGVGSLFDAMEDLDHDACLSKCVEIATK